jgi:hypothetical protein
MAGHGVRREKAALSSGCKRSIGQSVSGMEKNNQRPQMADNGLRHPEPTDFPAGVRYLEGRRDSTRPTPEIARSPKRPFNARVRPRFSEGLANQFDAPQWRA